MKVKYEQEVDVLRLELSNPPVEESEEEIPSLILDYDKEGNVVSIKILTAAKRISVSTSL